MPYVKRDIEPNIESWIDEREIVAIRGPRQSGKTTLLNNLKDKIAKNPNNDVFYISFEDDLVRLKFEENCKEFIKSFTGAKKAYFLLDEVQYVNDIGKKLKLIFDSFENIKIIISGSSSFELTTLGKYLVGRIVFFDLLPFSFVEFLRAKGERYERIYLETAIDIEKIDLRKNLFLDELNMLLHEYLTYGGFPRVVLQMDNNKKKELIGSMFSTYVEKDLVARFGNRYRDRSVIVLKTLAHMMGSVVNYESLANESGLKNKEMREILPLLQDSFVISIIKPFHRNIVTELRKNPKIYFVDFGFRNYLLGMFDNIVFDSMYENFICNQMKMKYGVKYWRTTAKTEIDFIVEGKELIPIEVRTSKKITRALRSFVHTYAIKNAVVANLGTAEKEMIEGCDVFAVPFAYF